MKLTTLSVACASLLFVVACTDSKTPAQVALKAAMDAYAPVKTDADRYTPNQAKDIEDAIAAAEVSVDKADWAAVLKQAQPIPAQIAALAPTIAAKKAELTTAWTAMTAGVPSLVGALKSRVDMLSKSKGVPAGLTKDIVEQARTGFAAASQEWSDAVAYSKAGDMATAMSKATDVKKKVVAIMTSLKMQIPKSAM